MNKINFILYFIFIFTVSSLLGGGDDYFNFNKKPLNGRDVEC